MAAGSTIDEPVASSAGNGFANEMLVTVRVSFCKSCCGATLQGAAAQSRTLTKRSYLPAGAFATVSSPVEAFTVTAPAGIAGYPACGETPSTAQARPEPGAPPMACRPFGVAGIFTTAPACTAGSVIVLMTSGMVVMVLGFASTTTNFVPQRPKSRASAGVRRVPTMRRVTCASSSTESGSVAAPVSVRTSGKEVSMVSGV